MSWNHPQILDDWDKLATDTVHCLNSYTFHRYKGPRIEKEASTNSLENRAKLFGIVRAGSFTSELISSRFIYFRVSWVHLRLFTMNELLSSGRVWVINSNFLWDTVNKMCGPPPGADFKLLAVCKSDDYGGVCSATVCYVMKKVWIRYAESVVRFCSESD